MPDRICSVPECNKPHRAKGFCKNHYYTRRETLCTVRGCSRPYAAKGFCKVHWKERTGPSKSCAECKAPFRANDKRKYCSTACRKLAMRSPVRRAVEGGDPAAIIAAARAQSVITSSGCWEWAFARTPRGYPVIGQGGRGGMVHRHVLAAVLGHPLPTKEPVHHKCANPPCVNPEHLQLVTHRENVAEMFARNYYLHRIAELEAALMEYAPNHSLISTAS